MPEFWVVGGQYTDTKFTTLADPDKAERIGPFASYAEAKTAWASRAWETVDDANYRFHIEQSDQPDDKPTFWVVGGVYNNTRFEQTVDELGEEWIGPFHSYEAAKTEWATRAWETVDDACARYRIEKRFGSVPEHIR